MRREVLQRAAHRIIEDLRITGLYDMFTRGGDAYQKSMGKEREGNQWIDVAVLADYFTRTSTYNDVEKHVLDIIGLSEVANPSTWQSQLAKLDASFIYTNLNIMRQALELLPRLLLLLDREYNEVKEQGSRIGEVEDGMAVQTVILSDEGQMMSSPVRIIELLSSITQIYGVIAEVERLPPQSIAIVGLDSGSEKSFDLLGLAKVMAELKEILQWVYNSVVFHKHNVTARNLQIASETLSVVDKIGKLEKNKSVTAEEAARMKHGLFNGLERFAATGAYIPEMNQVHSSPALAMRPQPRLLTASPAELVREANDPNLSTRSDDEDSGEIQSRPKNTNESNASSPNIAGYTPEQVAAAVKLLNEASSNVSEPAPRKRSRRSSTTTDDET